MSIRDLIADQCNVPVLQDEVNRLMATLKPISPTTPDGQEALLTPEQSGEVLPLVNSISRDEE